MPDAYDTVIADLTKRREDIDTVIRLLRMMKAMSNTMAAIPMPAPSPGREFESV
jgi:hypothetical protein